MRRRYNAQMYSNETIEAWNNQLKKNAEFEKKHTHETTKDYEVNGYIIRCIQRKYDECMKKENEYGVQVWTEKPENVSVDRVFEYCVSNVWFNNSTKANEHFKIVKAMCY